jgi:calcium-dependent protein kinase
MKTFRVQKKLQEAALIFMVNFLASKDEKNELLKQFQSLDLNNDGKLSRDELIIGYRKVLNEAEAEEEVDRIMKSVDKNDSGAIDYSGTTISMI